MTNRITLSSRRHGAVAGLMARITGQGSSDAVRIEPSLRGPAVPPGGAGRAYAAAKPDRIAGRFSAFGPTSPRADLRQGIRGLINHARWASQNVDYLRNYEALVRRHVIGRQGIALAMQVRDPGGRLDTVANDRIEWAWWEWGKRGNCTLCGRFSWWQVENMAATAIAREGNFLARIWRGAGFGPFRFQIEILSIDLLDLDRTEALGDGRFIESGIEFDARGRVLAYHLFSAHPTEYHASRGVQRLRVPASDIVHGWRAVEPMAALGPSESHTALRRFNMLAALEEAALTAARFGASNMAFFKRPEDDGPGGGGDVQSPITEIEAGTVGVLPPGWDLAEYKGNYPDGEFAGFSKALMKGGAAGLGVSYAALTGDVEGANYSSLRDGRGEERDSWRMFQRDLFETLHDQVFNAWLPLAILAGRVGLPFAKLDKYLAASWRPRGWPSVNPKDDATANQSDLSNMLRAPSEIVAERGGDWDETVALMARDFKMLREAGLPVPAAMQAFATMGGGAVPPVAPPDDAGEGEGADNAGAAEDGDAET